MVTKLLTNLKLASIFLSFFVFIFLAFHSKNVFAANPVPIPEPGRIACPGGAEPLNFNSLRPYQASPCGSTVKALFCSNDLNFIEDFQEAGKGDCQKRHQEGEFDCNPNDNIPPHNLYVDLSDAMFPIMGNTELVKNNVNTQDQIDDATKVNEYVSWYLNGVENRAEYGNSENTDSNNVNYSGVIQKIMPQAILEAQRVSVINSITTNTAQDSEDETAAPVAQPGNHNQIVVCAQPSIHLIPAWITNLIGINQIGLNQVPTDCYPKPGANAVPNTYRLGDWLQENKLYAFTNAIAPYLNYMRALFPGGVLSDLLAKAFTSTIEHWPESYPPLPWSDENGKPFASSLDYQKAYNEWRGQICTFIVDPFRQRHLVCLGLWPITSNPMADLFPYVPLAQTVDKKGSEYVTGVQFHPSQGTGITGEDYGQTKNGPLYFAHTQEVKDLSQFLNSSYTPKDVVSAPDPKTTEQNNCSAAVVRTNQGDNLFAGFPSGIEAHDVTYTINQVHCTETFEEECTGTGSNEVCKTVDKLSCPAEVIVTIATGTKTPFANEIFASTVADSGSTFRRIYPKVDEKAPVSCVADIPTFTNVTYDASKSQPPAGGDQTFKVGNKPNDGTATPDSPQLTFPHIGSIYEYFLKGIQAALRPQGFGDVTPISGTQCKTVAPADCSAANVPDSAIPSKYLGNFKANFIDLANKWTATCQGASNNLATQCYNYVVSEAQKTGVNPAFALTIWLNESGASNYCWGGANTQDFGINLSSMYQNVVEQLKFFLTMAQQKFCQSTPGFPQPIAGWLSRFKAVNSNNLCDPTYECGKAYAYGGDCQENGTNIKMGGGVIYTWQAVTGGCVNGNRFTITWPTDMNCP